MKYVVLLFVVLTGAFGASAQTATPTPRVVVSTPSNFPTSRDTDARFRDLNALEIRRTKEAGTFKPLAEIEQEFYRKPNKAEIKILAPAPNLLEKYAAFLRQPDTGIIKLNADASCVRTPELVVAKESCLQYTMPGAGTAYSFRVESYRLPRLADLILVNDVLRTNGAMQQGIMVNLGDMPLEDVTLQTGGLKYLLDFKPAEDGDALLETSERLSRGVKSDGFVYGIGFYVKKPTTYALRSIAYKGTFVRTVKGVSYNELDFDKRKDIVVAFRLIEKDASGNATILWKILSCQNAPGLKLKQPEAK